VIDDGVAEYYWLILWEGDIGEQNPEDWVMVRGQYEIEPDDQMLMTARLDASTIERGDYQAIIHYLSNDPDEGEDDLELPVLLHVTDAQDIEVAWEAEYGYPDLLDWNLAYDNVLVAQPYEMTITVENASMDVSDLVVSDIVSDDEDFSVDPTEFTLEPGASQEVIITFEADADAAGEYDALLTIYSDDPDEDEWPIPLHAAAVYDLQIAPAPESIASELMTGETDEITLNLSNESGDLRRFRIDREILSEPERDDQQRALRRIDRSRGPGRDAAGDLVDAFDEPVGGINRYKGLIWDADNEWMWISHYSSPYQCWPVDPDNDYQRVDGQGWNGFAGQMSGVMADNELYIVTFSGGWYVYRYSRQGQNLGRVNTPFQVNGVAYSAEMELMFFMNSQDNMNIHVYEFNGEGSLGGRVGIISNYRQLFNNWWSRSMCWVDKHPDGQLWVNTQASGGGGQGNTVHQILIDTDDWSATLRVQNFDTYVGVNGQPWDGIAHDGYNLWTSSYASEEIRIYDDGVFEKNWISYDPTEGELQGGEDMDVTVTLDASGLHGGRYEAELRISSPDPDFSAFTVPVTLDVTAAADIAVRWLDQYGYPDVVDWNAQEAYGDQVFSGLSYELVVTVENSGVLPLDVDEISSDLEIFSVDPAVIEALDPGEEVDIVVTLEADEAGDYDAVLRFVSNSEANPVVEAALHADVLAPPTIQLDPESELW